MIFDDTGLVWGNTCWHLVVLDQYGAELVDTWWYWVSRRRYWLIHDGTGSVWGDIYWYLVVLDQQRMVMVDTQ